MATQNNRKLAALNKENCEEHPRSNLAQNSNVPGSQEDYITQVSEEYEGRVTKRLSKEFSRTENRILGALARLDDFLMNPLLQGHSGATPEPSRNALSTSQGTNEDDSQKDPHPEAGLFHSHMTQNSGPEEGHDNCCIRTPSITFFSLERCKTEWVRYVIKTLHSKLCLQRFIKNSHRVSQKKHDKPNFTTKSTIQLM